MMSNNIVKDEFVFVVEPSAAMNANIVVDVGSGSADILQQALAEVTATTSKVSCCAIPSVSVC